jgi:hypothetical protein
MTLKNKMVQSPILNLQWFTPFRIQYAHPVGVRNEWNGIKMCKESDPPRCTNCKFFKNILPSDMSSGKCALFPIVENNLNKLVNGIEKIGYFYCDVARKHKEMCGKSGKHYRNRLPP